MAMNAVLPECGMPTHHTWSMAPLTLQSRQSVWLAKPKILTIWTCAQQKNGPSKMSMSLIPKGVMKLRLLKWREHPGLLCGPDVITGSS